MSILCSCTTKIITEYLAYPETAHLVIEHVKRFDKYEKELCLNELLDEAHRLGRYTLKVAAHFIAQSAGPSVDFAKIEKRLLRAAEDRSLSVYAKNEKVRWDSEMPACPYLEVHGDDMNTWLKENEPRIGPIFREPPPPITSKQIEPEITAISPEPWGVKAPNDLEPEQPCTNTWLEKNEPHIDPIFREPTFPITSRQVEPEITAVSSKPWEIRNPNDPEPEQPWFTPARYFARQHVKNDPTLLNKRKALSQKVTQSLTNAGVKKRGGRKPFCSSTILKALSNVSLG
ncbi:hypothetical protein [Nitrosomonas communis]|uniref:Uncharacterized protein n=1 Tax=Nitrosomonas communis TaxID=44574 RepID=A0A1I4S472_9PROT|nr:hypothetical protein [Nitrosomonas communis]SFM59084.1 hypothetical protein SAMN05421863_103725 [Nitrosomonas communis]